MPLQAARRSAATLAPPPPPAVATQRTRALRPAAVAAEATVGSTPFEELCAGTERKYVMVSGKGGVGKTSLAASLAVRFAQEGHTVLVVSTDPAHSLGDSLAQVGGPRWRGGVMFCKAPPRMHAPAWLQPPRRRRRALRLPAGRPWQDLSGGVPVLVEGTDLPLWGMEIDTEREKARFKAWSAGTLPPLGRTRHASTMAAGLGGGACSLAQHAGAAARGARVPAHAQRRRHRRRRRAAGKGKEEAKDFMGGFGLGSIVEQVRGAQRLPVLHMPCARCCSALRPSCAHRCCACLPAPRSAPMRTAGRPEAGRAAELAAPWV